jgi:hypothetical protein
MKEWEEGIFELYDVWTRAKADNQVLFSFVLRVLRTDHLKSKQEREKLSDRA